MAGIIFYHLDLETNGMSWKNGWHEITELSIIRASDRMQITRQVKVDKPNNSSLDALRITNKSKDDLMKGISKYQLIKDFEDFVGQDASTPAYRCLVGHNIINFDRKFLWNTWEKANKTFPFDLWLDTLQMMRAYAKKKQLVKPQLNLSASCDLFNIKKVAGIHNARSDVRNTYLLWEQLTKEIDYLDYISRMPHYDDKDNGNEY